jgi:hypothetical protein
MLVNCRKHPYGPPSPVTGIALFLYVDDVRTSQETHLWASTPLRGDNLTFLYVYDIHASQEAHLWASTPRYGDRFTFSYVDSVHSSEETHLWASTTCYGVRFAFDFTFTHILLLLSRFRCPRDKSYLKNDVFWNVKPCGSCKNRRLRRT